ncbi:MAG: hypothetical protein IKK83_03735 [Clostridia bacterium]|nr:hypothetical protein [Clostridia bacterium]
MAKESNAAATEEKAKSKKRRRRFGDRKDGRKVRTLDPMNYVAPYIMPDRDSSTNFIEDRTDTAKLDEYIRQKRAEGLKGFGALHVFIAAYVRVVSQRPGINRFISRQKIFARNNIEIMLTIKKELTLNATETIVEITPEPDWTATQIYEELNRVITENRDKEEESSFDSAAKALNYIPGLFLKFTVWFLKTMDYFGLLPKSLLKLSPFHGSMFITSMGSLGIPPIYHHLYDFGNVPMFMSYGAKYKENRIADDGRVEQRTYIDYKITTDERICDGHYYASALKLLRFYLQNPKLLDLPPEHVVEDID